MQGSRKSFLPSFGISPDHGFTMKGWDFSAAEIRDALEGYQMLNPAMELGSNLCPWNCDFCFTESPDNPDGRKRGLSNELSLEERLTLIDEVSNLGARSINFVGAGEPTIDPGFWALLERMADRRIRPIIYTEGSLRLQQQDFVLRLFDIGATVVLKVNSLKDATYQDRILRGIQHKPGIPAKSYFEGRKVALRNLMDSGFNIPVPTRLAFDTIICKENLDEIESIHRFARDHNIFVLFVNYLPSGRTRDGHTTAISWEEQHSVYRKLASIDKEEYGLVHETHFPYAGGVPCTIRGLGLFTKITGEVYDCPGESRLLGTLPKEKLSSMWKKVREITRHFDGGCFPRQEFWKRQNAGESSMDE